MKQLEAKCTFRMNKSVDFEQGFPLRSTHSFPKEETGRVTKAQDRIMRAGFYSWLSYRNTV